MRVLVTGWFSPLHGEATAGDLLAADAVCAWLDAAGVPYDVARSPVLHAAGGGGVLLDAVDPRDYTHLVWACGPAAGWQVEQVLERFAACRRVAVGVSQVATTPDGFDVLLTRDGAHGDRPDLSLAAPRDDLPPVVAVVRANPQGEYPDGRHDHAHEVVDEVLRRLDAAVVEVDTRVDPRRVVSRRTRDVEAVLARVDAVVTTRLHGLVLALRHGVPAVAVDPVPGGAKVARQAAVLGWPAALGVDGLTAPALAAQVRWALSDEARARARALDPDLERVRRELLAALRD